MSPIMHATCENGSQPLSTFAGHFRHLTDDSRTVHSRHRPRGFPVPGGAVAVTYCRHRIVSMSACPWRPWRRSIRSHSWSTLPSGFVGRMPSVGLTYLSFLPMVVGLLSHCDQDRKSTRLNSSHITISYAV